MEDSETFPILHDVILPENRGRPRKLIEKNVVVPKVRRGRPRNDNTQLIEKIENGLKSGEFHSGHHAAVVITKGVKGPSKEAIAQRFYRNRKAGKH